MNSVEPIRKPEEIAQLSVSLAGRHPKYAVMLAVGIDSGLRISDILALKVKDIRRRSVRIRMTVTEKKTKKARSVTLEKDTVKGIAAYVKLFGLLPDDYLVFSRDHKRNKSLSRSQAYRVISSISRLNGLRNVGTHSMRKTYAINQYRHHGSIMALKNDFNHKYEKTTLAYLISAAKMKSLIGE